MSDDKPGPTPPGSWKGDKKKEQEEPAGQTEQKPEKQPDEK